MKGKNFAIKQAKKISSKYFPDPSSITKRNLDCVALDLNKLALDLNITIVPHEFSGEFSGVFVREKGSNYIGVNISDPDRRKRFTIAHEIGHFILHSTDALHYDSSSLDSPSVVLYRANNQSNYNEVEANAFAAELLMPEDIIDRCLQLDVNTISDLAGVFEVSDDAMRYRLINLSYI